METPTEDPDVAGYGNGMCVCGHTSARHACDHETSEYGCFRCGCGAFVFDRTYAGEAHPTPPPAALAPERTSDDKRQWTLDNVYTVARREHRRVEDGKPPRPEMWAHVLRLCEAVGCQSRTVGVLREGVEEVAALAAAPPPARAEAPEGAPEAIADRLRNMQTVKATMDRIGNTPSAVTYYVEDVSALLAENARLTQALEQAQREIASLKEMLDTESEDATQWRREEAKERTRAEQAEAERDQQAGALGRLREALRKLRNDVSGVLGISETELREAAGNTNVNLLLQRIAEADAALAAAAPEEEQP